MRGGRQHRRLLLVLFQSRKLHQIPITSEHFEQLIAEYWLSCLSCRHPKLYIYLRIHSKDET